MYNTPLSVKKIEVIEAIANRGDGKDDPIRNIVQYWSFDGELLAERDPLDKAKITMLGKLRVTAWS